MRSLTDEAGRELPKIKDIIRPIARDVENYETQLAQHLVISSPLRNPFRNKRSDHIAGIDQSEPSVRAHKGSVTAKNKDNRLYAKATDTRKLGSLSCVVSLRLNIIHKVLCTEYYFCIRAGVSSRKGF